MELERFPPLGSSAFSQRINRQKVVKADSPSDVVKLRIRRSDTLITTNKGHNRGEAFRRPTSVLTLPLIRDAFLEQYAQLHTARVSAPLGPEECIRCMLQVAHKRCERHKYIRVGGGYRHSYTYLKSIMGDLLVHVTNEISEREMLLQAIEESREYDQSTAVKAVKTYMRTASGKLEERVIFLSAEDYDKFTKGNGKADVLKKYLTKEEAGKLESWDKEEVKMIKTFVRTKSGRVMEKSIYVGKTDYDKIKAGDMSADEMVNVLKRYAKTAEGETISGWGEAQTKQIKTTVRTKSGRLVEKTITVSKEEFEHLQQITKDGGDPSSIFKKYMARDERIESWHKDVPPNKPMKVIKTTIRTKSGRMVEKTVMLTEDEYQEFQESGAKANFLEKFLQAKDGERIEEWDKASTVYDADSDDELLKKGKIGKKAVGEDGNVYEIVIDEKTGKKYKKKLGKLEDFTNMQDIIGGGSDESEMDQIGGKKQSKKTKKKKGQGQDNEGNSSSDDENDGTTKKRKKKGKKKGKEGDRSQSDSDTDVDGLPSKAEVTKYKEQKEGKRDDGSDSEYSYRSAYSAGGTRTVLRRRKRGDGTYSAEEVYFSGDDEEGKARRRKRRRGRKHGAESDHSYHSVVSDGGTRKVIRRKKLADGKYGADEEYHSDVSIKMKKAEKKHKKQRKKKVHGSDSEYSYRSAMSAGGTKTKTRTKRVRDAEGKIIGHGPTEGYVSDSDEDFAVKKGSNKKLTDKNRNNGKRGALQKKRTDFEGGFSDNTTDTENEPDLEEMTESERKAYLEKKEQRKAQREKKRIEKYGEKYKEVMAQHEENKKQLRKERAIAEGLKWDSDEYEADPEAFKQNYKTMVTYERAGDRGLTKKDKVDERQFGLGHDDWSKADNKKTKKVLRKTGDESDYESGEERYAEKTKTRNKAKPPSKAYNDDSDSEMFVAADGTTKRRIRRGVDEVVESDYEYEIEYDEKGRVKRKKKKYRDGKDGSEYEYEYDKDGNVLSKNKVLEGNKAKKHVTRDKFDNDDGKYFEKTAAGAIKLREGKAKIDITRMSKEDFKSLGIDPNMSKQNIARALKEKFGDSLRIMEGGQKIGLKALEDYGSDANTDDLAGDSDLDTSTLAPGRKKIQILMKKGGNDLMLYMKKVVDDSELIGKPLQPEMDASIDFIQVYRLVDQKVIDNYAKAFVVEDDRKTGVIAFEEAKVALKGIPSIANMTKKQIKYVMKVLDVQPHSTLSFRMFGVAAALSERITRMDAHCKNLLNICDLSDIERKLELYKKMFYCNTLGDRDTNYIKCESLMIELIAGGLSWQQQDYVMSQLKPNSWREVSFLDYLVYIPLFLSMHDGICLNPLDMSLSKYKKRPNLLRDKAGRDMNPMKKLNQQKAQEILEGKADLSEESKQRNKEILHKYARLPDILGTMEKRPQGAPRYL